MQKVSVKTNQTYNLEKTAYKYTYKLPNGKVKKLSVFKTTKGKFVVFINDYK